MADILIVYSVLQWPPVAALRDALYAFERHSCARCWYLNLGVRRAPWWLRLFVRRSDLPEHVLLDRVNPPLLARHLRQLSG